MGFNEKSPFRNDRTIKQRLSDFGFSVERVYYDDGKYRGVRVIGPDGLQAHETPCVSVEFGIDLLKGLELS